MTMRTATLRLQMLDGVSGPAKGSSKALGGLEGSINKLGKGGTKGAKNLVNQLEHLRQKAAAVSRFTELRTGTAAAFGEFRTARTHVKALETALASVTKPTGKMQADLKTAQGALKLTATAFNNQRTAANNAAQGLRSFGLNSRTAISSSQTEIRRQMALTTTKMRQMRAESAKPLPAHKQAMQGGSRSGGMMAGAAGAYAAGSILANPVRKALSYDQVLTYAAGTMAGDGSVEAKQAAKRQVSDAVDSSIQQGGGTRDDAAAALNRLVSSGVFEGLESLQVLPAVVKTAFAAGASAEDVAGMAVGMKNNGVALGDMQQAFDAALRAGQLGGVELKDLARWLTSRSALPNSAKQAAAS